MIYYNNFNKLSSVYFGDKQISKVYYGNYKVYPSSDPTPTPSSDPLFTATLASDVASGSKLFWYVYKYNAPTSSTSASWSEAAILASKSYSKGDTISIYASDITGTSSFQGDIYGIHTFSDIYSEIKLENGINDWSWDVGCSFSSLKNLKSADLSLYTKDGYESLTSMFNSCSSLTSVTLNQTLASQATSTKSMFSGCTSLEHFETDLMWRNVTNSMYMFAGCTSLTSITLSNFGAFSTSNLYNGMFSGCTKLTEFTLNGNCLATSQYTYYYLEGANNITSIIDNGYRAEISLDGTMRGYLPSSLSKFHLPNATLGSVTSMSLAFYGLYNLNDVNLSSATFINLSDATQMFYGNNLRINLASATFDSLTQPNAKYMFTNADVTEIQINSTGQAKLIELNQTSKGIGLPSDWNDTSYSGWTIV
jgi:hypothetical protein